MYWSRKLRAARALSWAEWRLLWRAWWLLLLVDAGLRWLPFRVVQRWVDSARPGAEAGEVESVLREVAIAVDRAARHHLYPMTCLRRALVLQRLCKASGVPTRLCFGVRKIGENMTAHAWVEYNGKYVGEFIGASVRFSLLRSQPVTASAGCWTEKRLDYP